MSVIYLLSIIAVGIGVYVVSSLKSIKKSELEFRN